MGLINGLYLMLDLDVSRRQLGHLALVVIAAPRHSGALDQINDGVVQAQCGDYFGFGFVVASRA